MDADAEPEPEPDDADAERTGPDDAAGTGLASGSTPAGPAPSASARRGGGAGGLRRFTRRQVLTMAGATGLVGAGVLANRFVADGGSRPGGTATDRSATPARDGDPAAPTATGGDPDGAPVAGGARWSDPATWGGRVPGPDDVAVVDRAVVLDVDATVAGVRVEPDAELVFDPATSHTLTSTGNVVVAGTLRARPRGPDVTHVLAFAGVDESRIVGGHAMEPVGSDVGLWVVAGGALDLQGTPKRAWAHLDGPVEEGDGILTVADATGWQPGDEVVVTPTAPTTSPRWAERYDRRTVTAVAGTSVTLDRPLDFAHPAVTVRPGVVHHAEVLNLSRNVHIESDRAGRAHVMIAGATRPQHVAHVRLRRLGPQSTDAEGRLGGIEGRYALHFHMGGEGTRGSLVEGVVADGGGNHAFVPHLSDGITFRDCIAHDQAEIPYWWDPATDDQPDVRPADGVPTNDLTYERCVAHLIRPTRRSDGITGFMLGTGRGNVARGCVAVGVLGGDNGTSGFLWPAGSKDEQHTWTFEDCVSHNTYNSSIRVWQNVVPRTIIDRFTSYHDHYGIYAGAYANLVSYRDCTVYACAEAGGLVISAVPDAPMTAAGETITFENLHIDQAGLTEFAVYVTGHLADTGRVTEVTGCHFAGGTRAQVGFPEGGDSRQVYRFTDCTFEGNAFWLASEVNEAVDVVVTDPVHGALRLHRVDGDGELRSDWNARVTPA